MVELGLFCLKHEYYLFLPFEEHAVLMDLSLQILNPMQELLLSLF